MPNKKNSSKSTWVPLNIWEAQQKALIKANLEAMKSQQEAKEKAQRDAMMKHYDWGTPSGKFLALFKCLCFKFFLTF